MADHQLSHCHGCEAGKKSAADKAEHVIYDCFGKKEEENSQQDLAMADAEAVKKGEKHTLKEKLNCFDGHSSASSDEEGQDGEKKKNKKGLKEKIKEKITGENEGGDNGNIHPEVTANQEDKGLVDKIKEYLPIQKIEEKFLGHEKKTEESSSVTKESAANAPMAESNDKKSILEMVKDKLSGGNKDGQEDKQKRIDQL